MTKIVIQRSTQLGSDMRRYLQEVLVDGEIVGTFRPYHDEYVFYDRAGERLKWEHEQPTMTERFTLLRVYAISEMLGAFREALRDGHIPTDDDISKREAAREAEKGRHQAELIEGARIELIKDHAEELLEALDELLDDQGYGPDVYTLGDLRDNAINSGAYTLILKARTISAKARGVVDLDIESDDAREGTAAHELAELALTTIDGHEGHQTTLTDFNDACEFGMFTDDDGYGHAVCNGHLANGPTGVPMVILPSSRGAVPAHVTHILWYNR